MFWYHFASPADANWKAWQQSESGKGNECRRNTAGAGINKYFGAAKDAKRVEDNTNVAYSTQRSAVKMAVADSESIAVKEHKQSYNVATKGNEPAHEPFVLSQAMVLLKVSA